MILANGETLLREWTYATKKEGHEKSNCTLSVTDKRIVATESSNRNISQQEIYNKDVKSISFNHSVKSKVGAIMMIIFGILFAVLGIMVGMKAARVMLLPFILLGLSPIFLVIALVLNGTIHAFVDDLKANQKKINLVQDQSVHIGQIFLTWLIGSLIYV